jgi:hypothetical protein
MFGKRINGLVVFSLFFILITSSVSGYADDVEDSIKEALGYYQSGEYKDALDSLDYASQLIMQMKGKGLEAFLPEPLSGWTAQKATSQAAGAAMFGGGVTAERTYSKGPSTVTVKIITDSPMLQGMMMMFSNPMFASADGGRLERIARQKAIVKFDPATNKGEITMAVANRFLVTIKGSGVTREELKTYAEAIDYRKLKSSF